MIETGWKPDVCVYHGGCDDGFGAAWAVWMRWGDAVTYIPGSYGGTNWPAGMHGKNVLFVDFSLKRPQMIEFVNGGLTGEIPKSVVVLDHHKTAEAELADWSSPRLRWEDVPLLAAKAFTETGYPIVAQFDMNKSGARLAWEFAHPGSDVPHLLKYVEDRDLWRFALSGTAEVSAALRSHTQDFETWTRLAGDVGSVRKEGEALLRAHMKVVRQCCENAYTDVVSDYRVPMVNVPYHYASDCANELLKAHPNAPFAAAWFLRGDGQVQFSLRSEDGRVDVSEIAKRYGGGGHRNAAGFQIPAGKAGIVEAA